MKQKLISTSPKMSILYNLLSILYFFSSGNVCAQTHPFIIVKQAEYSNLQALATGTNAKPEFIQMRNTAINIATNKTVNVTASMSTRSATVRDIMDACALAYILDPAKRNVYRDKFYTTLKFWDLSTTGNLTKDLVSTSWDNTIPAEGAVFATVIAMDIIYNDPNTTPTQIIQRNEFNAMMERPGGDGTMGPVPFSAKVYPYHNQSHSAARGIWAIWKGGVVNNPALDAAVTLYKGVWLNYSSPDGVSREYTGYSLARSGDPKRYQKAAFQDVIAYTGIDPNWYNNPRMLNFNEWMAGYSLMPNKYSWPIGDTQYGPFGSDYLSPMSRAGIFSLKAGQYAEWSQDGKVPRTELFTYLLKARAIFSNNNQLIVAKTPESRIFKDGGAYLIEKNAGKQAMAVVLANLKYGTPGPESWGHTHFDVNNLCMAGFGEILLRGPGYNGYAAAATDANNFGFDFHYVNSAAVSNNVALFDYNIGTGTEFNYKNPSYTNAHAKKLGGQGVQGLLCSSLDYAMGDTSPVTDPNRAITKGQHIRHVVAVYPQDGINGYTYVMDELIGDTAVNVTNGQLTWHPYSAEITTNANNASNDRYEWKIRKYANTTDQLYLSIFMPTAPTAKQQYDGLFADDLVGGNTHSFVGKYIFNTYALNTTTKKKNVLTTLFPRKSTDAVPTMARINTTGTGTATQAVAFSFSGNVTDFSMESDGTNERTIVSATYDVEGASAQGKMAVYRKIAGNLAFYFVAKGRSFKNKPTGFSDGFVSDKEVDLYIKGKTGNISTATGANIRFYKLGITEIKINDVSVPNTSSGQGWVNINVPIGTHTIELIVNTLGNNEFLDTNFTVYPNPVKDFLNISSKYEITSVEIYNLSGKKIFNEQLNYNTAKINLSNFSNGTYIVKIFSNNSFKTIKIIKQ